MIIWLASYPRSGNTFLRVILNQAFGLQTYSIYDDVNDISADEQTRNIVGHKPLPRNFSISKARAARKCYIIKTHELPPKKEDKAIYLIRDGRESILSFKNYIGAYGEEEEDLTDIISGNVVFGSWGNHVKSWNPTSRNNTLLIKYEDMVGNPAEHVDKIAYFIGRKPKGDVISDFAELKKINPRFFRSGRKDSWKSVFSADEHIIFWLEHGREMEKHGYLSEKPPLLSAKRSNSVLTSLSSAHSHMVKIAQKKQARLIKERKNWDKLLVQKDKEFAKLQAKANKTQDSLKEKAALIKQKDKLIKELRKRLDEPTRSRRQKN